MHYEIYHSYSLESAPPPKKSPGLLIKLARIMGILGIGFILISFLPSVWYNVVSGGAEKISKLLSNTEVSSKSPKYEEKKDNYQPQVDTTLPYENKIKIPSIKVDTKVQEATLDNYESALKLGVWRVSDFGTPYDREKPTILAAHRYGYLAWSNLYRRQNSFYNLPKLKVGDIVEIDWRQRRYVYAVYAEGKGEEIADYSADLILYTCETLNSPIRIFKYARLMEL